MQDAIRKVIDGIERDCIFDSHYIISQLLKNYSDVFYAFIRSIEAKTNAVHGLLAKEISELEKDDIIERMENMSWSENIHGKSNPCAAWIRK